MVERFNDKVRSSEQVEKTFHLVRIGTMSRWRDKIQTEDGLVVAHHPHPHYAEMFREATAKLQFSSR